MTRSAQATEAALGLLTGQRTKASPQATEPMLGKVKSSGPTGVTFTLAEYDAGVHIFGPAPYNRATVLVGAAGGTVLPPPVGYTCLVLFVGKGVGTPVVIAWWP